MSKRHEIERQLCSFGEIKEIMNAMKNLALMETRKLSRVLATQQRVVASLREAAGDFIAFHPEWTAAEGSLRDLLLLIGSERGFCGDFNDAVMTALASRTAQLRDPALIVFGSKLASKLLGDPRVVERLEGPSTLDEVPSVLVRLMEALARWQAEQPTGHTPHLAVLHHDPGSADVVMGPLDPFSAAESAQRRYGYAPLLNVEPRRFAVRLTEHYLFAILHEIFYSSLMAENRRRMQHMDYAVHRIEQRSAELLRKRNSLRQEEITEEIEVIMLNAETLSAESAS